jgi:endoglucanase
VRTGRNRALTIGAAALAAIAVSALVAAVAVGFPVPNPFAPVPGASSSSSPGASGTPGTTGQVAQRFLADWVDQGRVVRRDQGGDTVSEGQSYGMLIALGIHDRAAFTSIWDWTKNHLERPDHLFAWRWDQGAVVDEQPASDADLEIARALLLAGHEFTEPSWTKAGEAVADSIAEHLTAQTGAGLILLPGLWAAGPGPYSYDPSYAAPEAIAQIAKLTGDPRWDELATGTRHVADELLQKSPLPPDWAQVETDGTVNDLPGPVGQGPSVRYSFDAARFAINAASSCDPSDTAMAARLAATLGRHASLPVDLDLGGAPIDGTQNPVAYLARASARAANGQVTAARADLKRAGALDRSVPTYYGAAWTALAPLLIDSSAIGGCPPLQKEPSS